MNRPLLTAEFQRPPAVLRSHVVSGLAAAMDEVAERAVPTHRFLRHDWFAAALATYGGSARTLVVAADGDPVIALPMVARGWRALGLAQVPGCYWPFRGVPAAADAGTAAYQALLTALAREVRALRWGPVYDDDPVLARLLEAARGAGWTVLDRFVAHSYRLDMGALATEGGWPRNSTLKKNRFHEKHLASHGVPDWSFVSGTDWTPAVFDALADIERRSWLSERTDGSDAKFTDEGHGAFWRAAATDPVIARMMWAAMLRIDGNPVAFSFDINAGPLKYAIANSYDPSVGKHSPGKLLYYRNLVRALADGLTCVDWGAGDSGYKRTIGAEKGPAIRDWLLVRPGIDAAAGRLLRGWWSRSGNAAAPVTPMPGSQGLPDLEDGRTGRPIAKHDEEPPLA